MFCGLIAEATAYREIISFFLKSLSRFRIFFGVYSENPAKNTADDSFRSLE